MKRSFFNQMAAALAAFIVTGAVIPYVTHAETPVEIVRPGDRAMTCAALAAEINTLGQPRQVATADAKPKKHGGLGFLKVLGAAAPMLGGVGGMAGGVASTVASTAGSASAQNQAQDQMADARQMAREAMAGGSAAQQRKERLTTIFDEKHC